MNNNIVPESLNTWVFAYEKIGENEYEFYLRDLPIKRLRIKAIKNINFGFYEAVTNYAIKSNIYHYAAHIPSGKSEDPICAVIMALTKFLLHDRVYELIENLTYPGIRS
jgi:hypothetical protein